MNLIERVLGLSLFLLVFFMLSVGAGQGDSIIAPGAEVQTVATGFMFAEGPAADVNGELYFTDLEASLIYRLTGDGQAVVVRENTGRANGLFFDRDGFSLAACEGGNRRIVLIDPEGNLSVLADNYNDEAFNEPNDLWIDPKGGIYFTDPAYDTSLPQDRDYVYYITPERDDVIRVTERMDKPNGIIGTPDGQLLYVTAHFAEETYRYSINPDGTLSNKELFAPIGGDGMTIDNEGNVYLSERSLLVYDSEGNHIETIETPERPTNCAFGDKDRHTLYITSPKSLFSLRMRVKGVTNFIADDVPVPEIRANRMDGNIDITPVDTLTITIALNPGSYTGEDADWWIGLITHEGAIFSLNVSSTISWVTGFSCSYQGGLFELPLVEILSLSGLPTGKYTFFFGVDLDMNCNLDTDKLYADFVVVNVLR